MTKRAAIPTLGTGNADVDRFAAAVKQNIDVMTGQQKNVKKLVPLGSAATTAEIIQQLNDLLERLS